MSDRFGERVKIIATIIAAISVIFSILQSDLIGTSMINDIYNNNEDNLFALFVMIGFTGFVIISVVAVIPVMALLFFVINKISKKSLSVSLLETSKLHSNGVLYLDVKFVGRMNYGYFTADILGIFDEYNIQSKHYSHDKQCGNILCKDYNFGWKWSIPDDFTPEKCTVTIKAKQTIKLFGFFGSIQYTIKECKLELVIDDISQNIEEKLHRYVDEKTNFVNTKTDSFEKKMYDYVNEKIDSLEEKMNQRFDKIQKVIEKIEKDIEKIQQMILDEPLKIIKTRYAKGEITKQEFEETKQSLQL